MKNNLVRFSFYYLSSRVIFVLFAILASTFIPIRRGYLGNQFDPHVPYLAWIWANFDGRHYLNIAALGYQHTNFAFFPLFSMLISLVGYIVPISLLYVGLLVSNVASLLAIYFLYKITKIDYGERIADTAIFFFCFLPFTFFYHSVYTDSLYLFLSTAAFYYARRQRWWLAGVFAGFAFFDRFSAIALMPAFALEWYLQDKSRLKLPLYKLISQFSKSALIAILLCALGLGVYMLYLQIFFGDYRLFQEARSAWSQDKFVFPLVVVYRYFKIFTHVDYHLVEYWVALLEFVSIATYLSLSVYIMKYIRLSYGVYTLLLLLIVPATGTFAGNPRYALHLFAAYIALAIICKKYPKAKYILYVLFLILGLVLTGLFTRGYFIS